jgi:hypothetical protein
MRRSRKERAELQVHRDVAKALQDPAHSEHKWARAVADGIAKKHGCEPPVPPPAPEAEAEAPRPSNINAMTMDGESYRQLLMVRGFELPPGAVTDACNQKPVYQQPRYPLMREAHRVLDRERDEYDARQQRLAATAIDASKSTPEDINHRLRELGIGGLNYDDGELFVDPPVAPPPVAEQLTGEEARVLREQRATRSVQRKIEQAKSSGRTLDVRKLDSFEWDAYQKIKGFSVTNAAPGTGNFTVDADAAQLRRRGRR